ncbi:MAG: hypothetical protein NW206_18030 [Hyphomonadaceae bacterium]|nr:hypothetical protein [Hyphomonadaceae bacterium]
MTEYALLRAVAQYGRLAAALLALAAAAAILCIAFPMIGWPAALYAALCAGLVFIVVASYSDLIRLTIEMLLPRR